MAGLEVLAAATSVVTLLDTAIKLAVRAQDAYDRQKDLANVFERHSRQLEDTRAIVQIIKNEEGLRTAAVARQLSQMETIGESLVNCLRPFDPAARGFLRGFFHQLLRGLKDERTLTSIFDELGRAKNNLILHIQVAGVGVTRAIGDGLAANLSVVTRVDHLLRESAGERHGLKIAELLKDRIPRDNGMIPLSDVDLATLSCPGAAAALFKQGLETALPADELYKSQRIIVGNLTRSQALQINGSVGEDMWKSISRLEIRDNVAGPWSAQVNYPISTADFHSLLVSQLLKIIFVSTLLLALGLLFFRAPPAIMMVEGSQRGSTAF